MMCKSDSIFFYQNLVQTLNDFHKTFDATFNVIDEQHFFRNVTTVAVLLRFVPFQNTEKRLQQQILAIHACLLFRNVEKYCSQQKTTNRTILLKKHASKKLDILLKNVPFSAKERDTKFGVSMESILSFLFLSFYC